jgi:hypothetical protein
MPLRGRGAFRQRDVIRALKAARAAGMSVTRFEIDPITGKIVVIMSSPENVEQRKELDKWIARRADIS